MMRKILLMLCSSALVSAGIIGTDYSPATAVYYSSISIPIVKNIPTPIVEKTIPAPKGYTKYIQSSPVYESILTTKESNYESHDGTKHTTFSKSLDTGYSSLKKLESKSSKDSVIANTIPGIYSTDSHPLLVYHAGPAYTLSSPVVHTTHTPALTKSVTFPVTYTTHDVPITKTIVAPSIPSYATPVIEKIHLPVTRSQPVKTTITYSEAPMVSHMSFTGLGTSYSW